MLGFAEQGMRSSVVRLPNISHSTRDRTGFLAQLIAIAKEKGVAGYPGTERTAGPPCIPAMPPPCSGWQ